MNKGRVTLGSNVLIDGQERKVSYIDDKYVGYGTFETLNYVIKRALWEDVQGIPITESTLLKYCGVYKQAFKGKFSAIYSHNVVYESGMWYIDGIIMEYIHEMQAYLNLIEQ